MCLGSSYRKNAGRGLTSSQNQALPVGVTPDSLSCIDSASVTDTWLSPATAVTL
jgi:hypothetical protein